MVGVDGAGMEEFRLQGVEFLGQVGSQHPDESVLEHVRGYGGVRDVLPFNHSVRWEFKLTSSTKERIIWNSTTPTTGSNSEN